MMTLFLIRAYRSFTKNTFFSLLNVFGLAIGMAVFLLIAQYVHFETSYESFVPNASSIYRVRLDLYQNNELIKSTAENFPAAGPAMAANLPEVVSSARLYNMGFKNNVVITNEEALPNPIAFKHRRFLYADSSFLPMMGYTLVYGDAATALAQPNTAVLTEEYAMRYFGTTDPIGKSLRLRDDDNNNELVHVTGVVKAIPGNTHLKFDVLFSYKTLFARVGRRPNYATTRFDQSWQRNDMYTYIQVRPGTDIPALEAKFPALIERLVPNLKETHRNYSMSPQPLEDIHLTSSLTEEFEPNGDSRIVQFLGIIGLFVLAIALINYINLSTAKAMERAKEVGVRKVMGAVRFELIRQFLIEAALINMLAIMVAVASASAALPAFNTLSGLSLSLQHFIQPWFLALTAALWVAGSLLSGFYPALVLSSFKPVTILKGKLKNSSRGVVLRKALVVVQFMASVALIAGTFIVYRQLNYMMTKDIGVTIDQVLVIERPGLRAEGEAFTSAIDVFRHELKKDPSIQSVAASTLVPGISRNWTATVKRYGAPDDQLVSFMTNSMDYEFIDVFGMKLLAGRAFSRDYPSDPDTAAIITASAASQLGFKSPEAAIGQAITLPEWPFNPVIVGVVNDYHQVSLKQSIAPTFFYCTEYEGEYYSMHINTQNLPGTINHIRASWEKAFPGNPFDFFFLDDYFNRQYKNERQFGGLFTTFAAIALLIGCLGLFGLSAYTATQRTKEIGIRKVLGSSEAGIFLLLSREYIKLVLLATVLGMPVMYFLMDNWVKSFAYHTPVSLLIFVAAGGVVLIIALLTISVQTLRAARSNPVDSLRYE